MGQISSVNLEKSIAINCEHNDRTTPPSYLIVTDSLFGCECNRTAEQARELKNEIIAQAKENYTKTTKQKFQAKSYEWSAVVNIKSDTTMQDLEKLAQHFEKKYGFQCYQIAIHRDEGYKDENGEIVLNEHAHLEFITLDRETGKNRQRELTATKLRGLQTETAEILQMQRGQDKRLSGAKRIKPREYARQKETEKKAVKEATQDLKKQNEKLQKELEAEKLSKKQLAEIIETERKKMANENKALKEANQNAIYNADDYKQLRALKEQQDLTLIELNEQIQRLKDEAKKREAKINELESDLKAEKQKNDKFLAKQQENDLNTNSERLNDINEANQILISKNLELDNENEHLKLELETTKKELEVEQKKQELINDKSDKYEIAKTILTDYEKAKKDSIKRATETSGVFSKKETINYAKAYELFTESMDNEHNAIKKAVLGNELGYYERENSIIKHIKNYLGRAKDTFDLIHKEVIKLKDKTIEALSKELKQTKQELKELKEKYTFIENLYNSKHNDLAMQEIKYEQEQKEKKLKLEQTLKQEKDKNKNRGFSR